MSVCCCGQFDQCWTTFRREEEEPMIFSLRVRPGDLSLDSIPTKTTTTTTKLRCRLNGGGSDVVKVTKRNLLFFLLLCEKASIVFQRTQARNKSELVIILPGRDVSLNVNQVWFHLSPPPSTPPMHTDQSLIGKILIAKNNNRKMPLKFLLCTKMVIKN